MHESCRSDRLVTRLPKTRCEELLGIVAAASCRLPRSGVARSLVNKLCGSFAYFHLRGVAEVRRGRCLVVCACAVQAIIIT